MLNKIKKSYILVTVVLLLLIGQVLAGNEPPAVTAAKTADAKMNALANKGAAFRPNGGTATIKDPPDSKNPAHQVDVNIHKANAAGNDNPNKGGDPNGDFWVIDISKTGDVPGCPPCHKQSILKLLLPKNGIKPDAGAPAKDKSGNPISVPAISLTQVLGLTSTHQVEPNAQNIDDGSSYSPGGKTPPQEVEAHTVAEWIIILDNELITELEKCVKTMKPLPCPSPPPGTSLPDSAMAPTTTTDGSRSKHDGKGTTKSGSGSGTAATVLACPPGQTFTLPCADNALSTLDNVLQKIQELLTQLRSSDVKKGTLSSSDLNPVIGAATGFSESVSGMGLQAAGTSADALVTALSNLVGKLPKDKQDSVNALIKDLLDALKACCKGTPTGDNNNDKSIGTTTPPPITTPEGGGQGGTPSVCPWPVTITDLASEPGCSHIACLPNGKHSHCCPPG